jgi:hypothetical protein
MSIKYFGELGKSCSIQTTSPASHICRSTDIVPRAASPVNRAYIDEPPSLIEQPGAPHQCNEEGCPFAASNKNTLTRHIHAQHVPRGSFNNLGDLERSLRASQKNRGFLINPSKNTGKYMLFSPRITEATSHPGGTIFPNLFIGTDEANRRNPRVVYRKTTLEECEGDSTRILLNLEDYISSRGRVRPRVEHPFATLTAGSRLTLYDIVAFVNNLYPGERVDLYIIVCLDAIPQSTIDLVEESVREAERPWRGLMNLGLVASSVPYLRPRARSRSANRRNRRNNTRRRGPNSRSAAPPRVEDE